MKIPKKFTLHNHVITVTVKDIGECYGSFSDAREEIILYRRIKTGCEIVELKEQQIWHTFLHELSHAIQWHMKGEYNEQDAQSMAGLLCEFFATSDLTINPNIVHEPLIEHEISKE